MSGKRIEMFRIKVHPAKQGKLLPRQSALNHSGRVGAMVACVQDRPELDTAPDSVWRIGNVDVLPHSGKTPARLVFQFGKTFVKDDEDFDSQKKVFYRLGRKEHKHIMVYLDASDERRIFGGIESPKKSLAPHAVRVADALKDTINQRLADAGKDAEVSIDPVYNTDKFERQLESAHAVTVLSVSFGRPNDPLDVKGMLYKPATQMSEGMGADESTHTFKGEHLRDAADFARNAADGGFAVSASIKESVDAKPKKISPEKRRLEKVETGEDEESDSVFHKIARWIKSRKGGRDKS